MRRTVLTAIALLIVTVTIWPPSTFVGHSHWDQVEWIPFTHALHPLDILLNVLLFTPFGAAFVSGHRRAPIVPAVLAAALLSLSVETVQVYCHGHFPTMTDVLSNVTGAWLGARLAARRSAAAVAAQRAAEPRLRNPRQA